MAPQSKHRYTHLAKLLLLFSILPDEIMEKVVGASTKIFMSNFLLILPSALKPSIINDTAQRSAKEGRPCEMKNLGVREREIGFGIQMAEGA